MNLTFHRDTSVNSESFELVRISQVLCGICASEMSRSELAIAAILGEGGYLVPNPVKYEGTVVDYVYERAK
jgi:hypothetical protein